MSDITRSENVIVPLQEKTRNCKDVKSSGVATQKTLKKDLKKVTSMVTTIYDILKIYGYCDDYNKSGDKDDAKAKSARDKQKLKDRILQYVSEAGVGSWKDFFKYKINAYFSSVMGQEIPPFPKGLVNYPDLLDPSFLCYGRGKRFIHLLKNNRNKQISFAQSIAQSKKGAPAVSPEMVGQAENDCFVWLTTEHPDIPDFKIDDGVFEHSINRNTVCYQLRRTVREIFRGSVPAWDELTKPFVPSTSSQYNFSRGDLGAIGAFSLFLKKIGESPDIIEKDVPTLITSKIKFGIGPCTLRDELTELYGKAGVEDQKLIDEEGLENAFFKETLGLHYNAEELCTHWKNKIYPELINAAIDEDPHTIIIGLPEPLKVRCITAGPPLTYTVLKPLQKYLWKKLKDLSVFQLIGTPVTPLIVHQQLGELGINEEFISGDYKASTDYLHSWVSECLLNELLDIWREEVADDEDRDIFWFYLERIGVLMKRALTGHSILNPAFNQQYREGLGLRDEDFKPQKEGQLMGSIISFPFLCLANAALCRYAMEISEEKNFSVIDKRIDGYTKARLLVNGDDCVFPGQLGKGFSIWKQVTAFAGLISSVGKTFQSREFLTINSCQYSYKQSFTWEDDIDRSLTDQPYTLVKYVNMGLVYAQKKDGKRGKPFYRLGPVHRDLHNTCPPELFAAASKVFRRENSKDRFSIKRVPSTKVAILDSQKNKIRTKVPFSNMRDANVPYYLPEWLGGLGLVPDKGIIGNLNKEQNTKFDLMCATYVRENMENPKIRPMKFKETPGWQFHTLTDERLIDYRFLDNQNFSMVEVDGTLRMLEEEYQKLYSYLVVDILLTTDCRKLAVSVEGDDKMLQRIHNHNSLLWKIIRQDAKKGLGKLGIRAENISEYEDFLHEKKDFTLSCFDVRK